MPRDGSNIYHTPPGTPGIPNTTIASSPYNGYLADIEQDLNTPRPIVAGGTGATSADGALTNLSAEKAAQIVTSWDSTVWMAGSYYAATSATGIAPVTGHAFAGIAYVSNAVVPITDMVLEATDLTDPANPDKYIRIMAAGVWGPWTRLNPNTSSANLGEYTFNNQITFPPAAGQVRFNNATENSTTEVFISHLTAAGVDNTTQITSYVLSGVDLIVQDKDEGNKYKVFTTTAAAVLSGGDFRVTVVLKIAGIDVVSAQRMLLSASGEAQRVQQRQLIYAAPFDALAYNGMQVNGSMEVSQENGTNTISVSATSKYIVDGWTIGTAGAQVLLCVQQPLGNPPGYSAGLEVDTTTINSGPAAGDFATVSSSIEGYRISRLAWGTANAQPVSIGFWVWANRPGNYSGSVRNVPNRSYVFRFTINAASTWEYKTVTVPGDTAGTWATTNAAGISLSFTLVAGTTLQTAAGVWTAGNFVGATGTINSVNATTDRFGITGVVVLPGLDVPSAARSPLIMRPQDQEVVTCKRYLRIITAEGAGLGNTTTAYFTIRHDGMRSAPTITAMDQLVVSDIFTANYTQSSPNAVVGGNNSEYGMYIFNNFTGIVGPKPLIFNGSGNNNRIKLDARLP